MVNASRMRIICDPFKKEIEYQWYDSNIEDYVEFEPENSKLASEEFVNATIQNRAYEIIKLINTECNVGNVGLEIVFVGTDDDYNDFCNVVRTYYSDANISCIRDNIFYRSATEVLPKIKVKFSEVRSTLEEYAEEEISNLVNKYNDVVKPSISLCAMGLYSSGKSAFINSIVGAEVLPSASDPTTAKVCKISCGDKYQIRFFFDKNECVLTFNGKTYKPNSKFDKDIVKKLQEIVKNEKQADEITHMNRALEIINNYSNPKHCISDVIEISLPFIKSDLPTDEFDFVIFDTPGSNSDNNVKHFEVLRDSLDKQTNALPIFLTTPDTMDAEDNDKILRLIEETGTSLDTTNAIVVVNKSDEKGPKTLKEKREKCNSLRITIWKSTRIFFVSSLIGIASKKNNPDDETSWIDEDLFEIYDEKKAKYIDDERQLFEFNIVDESKKDSSIEYISDSKTDHLYKNSGLEAVEKEIIEYARKYALYNKCQQASSYLQDAIELCVKSVKEYESKLNKELDKAKGKFDNKKNGLCGQLEDKKKIVASYNTEFQKLMSSDFQDFIKNNHLEQENSEAKKVLRGELFEEWKKLKEEEKKDKAKKEKKWALSKIQEKADDKYNNLLAKFSESANVDIDKFWDWKSNCFKNDCIKIVHDSEALTHEQKEILESIVLSKNNMSKYRMDFNLRKIGAIRHRRFLVWELKSEKFDINACCDQLVRRFNDAVRKRITSSEVTNSQNFTIWVDNLIGTLVEQLCKFNSDLQGFEQQIVKLKMEINSKKECETMLINSKEYIDSLIEIYGGEHNE